jgi:hypothetical protein
MATFGNQKVANKIIQKRLKSGILYINRVDGGQ